MSSSPTGLPAVTASEAATWAEGLQHRLANYHLFMGNTGAPPLVELEAGPKWIRIVVSQPGTRSAYGFISQETGLLYKAAGWKAPAKGVRGNIRGRSPYRACGPYGMASAR